jgi:protein gp37
MPANWRKPCRIFVNSMSDTFHESMSDEIIERVLHLAVRFPQHTFQVLTKRAENMRRVVSKMYGTVAGPFPNLWLGVSIENRKYLHRLDNLRTTPARIRFVSFEPLLEDLGVIDLRGIDQAIIGGESGPHARVCNLEWMRNIVRQCRAADTAVFVKQGGASNRCPHDRKGECLDCLPEDLHVREFPQSMTNEPLLEEKTPQSEGCLIV